MQPEISRDAALFRHGVSPNVKCLIGIILAAALVVLDGRSEWSGLLRNGLERFIAPLMVALELPGEAAREVGRGLTTQGALLRQIANLERDNAELRTRARSLVSLQRENDELRTLAGLSTERLSFHGFVQLIQRGRGIASQRFLIDAGSRQGIRAGMALIHPDGIVGQVTTAGEVTADVALVTDAGQHTPVEVVRTGLRAVMVGEGVSGLANLKFVASNADVEAGDELVTSGLDGVYPAGMAVAKVISVKRDSQSEFSRILCAPVAGMDKRRHFAVVVPATDGAPEASPTLPDGNPGAATR